jgi:hypothetical protein
MPQLFGQHLSKTQLQRRIGDLRQVVGVELYALQNGPQSGLRVLEFKTGSGLCFTVLVDRSMDFGRFDYRGTPFAWQSGTGFRHPSLMDAMGEGGNGFMRGFSGLLCTCGLDHIRQPDRGSADHFDLPLRAEISYPMHGRGALQPAQLDGYGLRWDGDEAVLWCEGTVHQVQVMGEHLSMTRRIEVAVGGTQVHFTDTVRNHGFARTPHMLLYHINLGWPLLDEGARFSAPITATLAANMPRDVQQADYRVQSPPQPRFVQQVFDHAFKADAAGRVPTALVNDRLGLGFGYEFDADAFRCLQQWQALGEGTYGFGIEPATSHWGSRADAQDRGEVIELVHDETRTYRSSLSVLDGAEAIAAHEQRVAAITPLLTDGFPPRTRQPAGGPLVRQLPARTGAGR